MPPHIPAERLSAPARSIRSRKCVQAEGAQSLIPHWSHSNRVFDWLFHRARHLLLIHREVRQTPGHTDTPIGVCPCLSGLGIGQAPGPGQAGAVHDVPSGCAGYRSPHFFVGRMMRFTSESDTPNVRAMVAGFRPALNDARIRFALPSGISTTWVASIGDDVGRDASGAEPSLVPPVEVLCFRLAISTSTAA